MAQAVQLKCPSLIGPDFFLSSHDVSSAVGQITQGLERLQLIPNQPLGIVVDASPLGIALVFSTIALGLPVALIPIGEPTPVIDDWLDYLNVDVVIYSNSLPNILASKKRKIAVADFCLEKKQAKVCHSMSDRFLSIIRTSGSTAGPKNALVKFSAHLESAQSVVDYFFITEQSYFGLNLPLWHVSGLSILFRAMISGCTIYLAKNNSELCLGLKAQQISHLSLVPAQLSKLLDQSADLTSLRAVIIGGDGLPEPLAQEAMERDIRLFSTYGLTETASMIYAYDHKMKRGQILPHATLKISSRNEILVGGSSLFSGYFPHLDDQEREFFSTKDLGGFDENGILRIFGRSDNQIICGGENILPEEIENALHRHPQIRQCVVAGVADSAYGQRLSAFVRFRSEPVASADLIEYLNLYLPKFKIPKIFLPWPKACPLIQKKARMWLKKYVGLTEMS